MIVQWSGCVVGWWGEWVTVGLPELLPGRCARLCPSCKVLTHHPFCAPRPSRRRQCSVAERGVCAGGGAVADAADDGEQEAGEGKIWCGELWN